MSGYAGEVPAVPSDEAPAVPNDEAPAVPNDEAPAVPNDEAPAVPSTGVAILPEVAVKDAKFVVEKHTKENLRKILKETEKQALMAIPDDGIPEKLQSIKDGIKKLLAEELYLTENRVIEKNKDKTATSIKNFTVSVHYKGEMKPLIISSTTSMKDVKSTIFSKYEILPKDQTKRRFFALTSETVATKSTEVLKNAEITTMHGKKLAGTIFNDQTHIRVE